MLAMFVAAAAVASAQPAATAGLQSYYRARKVLDDGVAAIGGLDALRALQVVRRELSGDWFGSGQSQRPYRPPAPTMLPPPSNEHNRIVNFIDYRGKRSLDDAIEWDFSGDSVRHVTAVSSAAGFETLTYRNEQPFHRSYSAPDLPGLAARSLRRYPEGLLLAALDRPQTLTWVGDAAALGARQRVISFSDALGTRILLYFDRRTGLLTKSEILRDHPVAGDSFADTIYSDYRAVGKLRLPFHHVERVAGVPSAKSRAVSIDAGAAFPDEQFAAPREFVPMAGDPSEPAVQKLSEGLYLLRGPYNTMFAVFGDFVLVFEAPLGSRYSETCLNAIRATAPGKPIRYVVATHFHFDHIAGLRAYVAEGIPILTTPDAKGVIEQAAASIHTMLPDALSKNALAPKVETMSGQKVFDDGSNRVELYDFGPFPHVAQMLVAYFPKAQVLFEADVWDVPSPEMSLGGIDTVRLGTKIRELGLRVERIIPVHGSPTTMETFERALAVRAKYVK